jgi:hypothetical protein
MLDIEDVDEACLDGFRPGYADLFISYHAKKFKWTGEYVRTVTRDAIRFMALCAKPPSSMRMVSSPDVDKIVDAIMLDTLLLRWLEKNVFGAGIVHVPFYAHGVTDAGINNARYEFTIALMQAAGYEVDPKIWPDRLPQDYATCTASNDLEDCQMYAQPFDS